MPRIRRPEKPRPWPLYLDPLWDDPDYRRMDFEGRGLIAAIIQAFWTSNLCPVPNVSDDEGWAAFIGARVSVWTARKANVLPVWARYEPELRISYARRQAWRESKRDFAARATAAATAARQARKLAADQAARGEPEAMPQTWKPASVAPAAGESPSKLWKD